MLFDIYEFREGIMNTQLDEIPIPQLQILFEQLKNGQEPSVDIPNLLDFLAPWMSECVLREGMKFPQVPGDKSTQEDAAEFLLYCILNKLPANILDPISLKYINRRQYRNGSPNETMTNLIKNDRERVIGTKPFESPLSPLNLIPYRHIGTVQISQLINEYFHLIHKNNSAEKNKKNQIDHIVPSEMPLYFIFSMNRNFTVMKKDSEKRLKNVIKKIEDAENEEEAEIYKEEKKEVLKSIRYESFKVNTDVKLENSVNIEETAYNLYGVIIHEGEGVNSGHYYYLFKETPEKWIVFNDDRIYTMTDIEFRTEYQKKVILTTYKKASEDRKIPLVENVSRLLPEIAKAEANAKAKAEANAKAKAGQELQAKKEAIKKELSFLIGKTVFQEKTYRIFTIVDIEISSKGKLLGVKIKNEKGVVYSEVKSYNGLIIPLDTLSEDELYLLTKYKHDAQEFTIQPQIDINTSIAIKLSEGGRRRRNRTRKVEARKRKGTRKA